MPDYSTLNSKIRDENECFVLESIDSTNDFLSNLPFSKTTKICTTAQQTCGKGQYGRTWHSEKGGSIIFSISRFFPHNTNLNGLSLVVGLALLEVLNAENKVVGLSLKWPNDVYFKEQKFAGILLENRTDKSGQTAIIGFGINYNLSENAVADNWSNLVDFMPQDLDPVDFTANLINKIIEFCEIFEVQGFSYFREKWSKFDYLKGRQIECENFSGTASGINSDGALLIKTKHKIAALYSSKTLIIS